MTAQLEQRAAMFKRPQKWRNMRTHKANEARDMPCWIFMYWPASKKCPSRKTYRMATAPNQRFSQATHRIIVRCAETRIATTLCTIQPLKFSSEQTAGVRETAAPLNIECAGMTQTTFAVDRSRIRRVSRSTFKCFLFFLKWCTRRQKLHETT